MLRATQLPIPNSPFPQQLPKPMNLTEQIQAQIQDLPEDAQLLLLDFIQILKKRFLGHEQARMINWEEPFVRMWKDEPEKQDSTAWVKQLRQNQWQRNND